MKHARRTRHVIYYEILKLCQVPKIKTEVIYNCNLSNDSFVVLIDVLLERKLLVKQLMTKKIGKQKMAKRTFYITTNLGLQFMIDFRKWYDILKEKIE